MRHVKSFGDKNIRHTRINKFKSFKTNETQDIMTLPVDPLKGFAGFFEWISKQTQETKNVLEKFKEFINSNPPELQELMSVLNQPAVKKDLENVLPKVERLDSDKIDQVIQKAKSQTSNVSEADVWSSDVDAYKQAIEDAKKSGTLGKEFSYTMSNYRSEEKSTPMYAKAWKLIKGILFIMGFIVVAALLAIVIVKLLAAFGIAMVSMFKFATNFVTIASLVLYIFYYAKKKGVSILKKTDKEEQKNWWKNLIF